MVNDGHTTRPHSHLGGRYIDGKPRRGPARYTEVQEVHEATSTLHNGLRRPRQRSALPTALLYRKVYQVRKEFGPAGGIRDPESQESIAPNPNPNDFILEPTISSWSQGLDLRRRQLLIKKCSDPKIWIQEVYRRVPQPRPRQRSAEAITVGGIIIITNVEVDDRGSNQTRQLKIIPQLKSHNLAGVFRYWLEAISDRHRRNAVQFKLALY